MNRNESTDKHMSVITNVLTLIIHTVVIRTLHVSVSERIKQGVPELVEIVYTPWSMMILIGGMTMIIITMSTIHNTEALRVWVCYYGRMLKGA